MLRNIVSIATVIYAECVGVTETKVSWWEKVRQDNECKMHSDANADMISFSIVTFEKGQVPISSL